MQPTWSLQSNEIPTTEEDALELLLKIRGVTDIEAFFSTDLKQIHPPSTLLNINNAVDFVVDCVKKGKKIYIHGDYDADGIIATSILWDYLSRKLNANVMPIIPTRGTEGYGLSEGSLQRVKDNGGEVVITVDCGIRDKEIIDKWSSQGLEFLVTDHHQFNMDNDGNPIISNKAIYLHANYPGGKYPFKKISGGTTAWKLIWAIEEVVNGKDDEHVPKAALKYIDLVAITVVSDIMPLIDENRVIVKYGLKKIRETTNIGLRQLLVDIGLVDCPLDTYHIGFQIAPRINATGRIGNAIDAVRLFSTHDELTAIKYSAKLNAMNSKRQDITMNIFDSTNLIIGKHDDKKIIIVVGTNWEEGIVGLLAGKISDKYHKPAIVLTRQEDGTYTGSARSITKLDIMTVLNKHKDLLIRYGGHAQAAGVTLTSDNLTKFINKVENTVGELLTDEDIIPNYKADFELVTDLITKSFVDSLDKLKPFGLGNKKPVFIINKAFIISKSYVGKTKSHAKLSLKIGNKVFNGIGFGLKDKLEMVASENVNIMFTPEINVWNGNSSVQLVIKDIKEA